MEWNVKFSSKKEGKAKTKNKNEEERKKQEDEMLTSEHLELMKSLIRWNLDEEETLFTERA